MLGLARAVLSDVQPRSAPDESYAIHARDGILSHIAKYEAWLRSHYLMLRRNRGAPCERLTGRPCGNKASHQLQPPVRRANPDIRRGVQPVAFKGAWVGRDDKRSGRRKSCPDGPNAERGQSTAHEHAALRAGAMTSGPGVGRRRG